MARFLHLVSRVFCSQIIAAGFAFLNGFVTARALSVADRGLYALFFATAIIGSYLFSFGVEQSTIYYTNRRRSEDFASILSHGLLTLTVGTLLGTVCLLVARETPWVGFSLPHAWLLILATILSMLEWAFNGLGMGKHCYQVFSDNILFRSSLSFLVTIIAYLLTDDLDTFLLVRIFALTVALGLYGYRLSQRTSLRLGAIQWPLLKLQWRFGLKNYIQNLVNLINYRMYLYFLLFFVGQESVGILSIALVMIEAMRLVPTAIGSILLPKLMVFDEGHEADLLSLKCLLLTAASGATMALCLAAAAGWLIPLAFSVAYQAAVTPFRVMLVGAVAGSFYEVLARFFTSRHLQRHSITAILCACLSGSVLACVLIPHRGVFGAALAFTLSQCVAGGLMLLFYSRCVGLDLLKNFLRQRFSPARASS